MSLRREWFEDTSFTTLSKPILVHLGDNTVIEASAKGTLRYYMDVAGQVTESAIPDVLYAPELAATLISVSRLTKRNYRLEFDGYECHIFHKPTMKIVAKGVETSGGLCRLKGKPILSTAHANLTSASRTVDINLLHRRLALAFSGAGSAALFLPTEVTIGLVTVSVSTTHEPNDAARIPHAFSHVHQFEFGYAPGWNSGERQTKLCMIFKDNCKEALPVHVYQGKRP